MKRLSRRYARRSASCSSPNLIEDDVSHLRRVDDTEVATKQYLDTAFGLIRAGRLNHARKIVVKSTPAEDYVDVFRWACRSYEAWSDVDLSRNCILLAIRRGMIDDPRWDALTPDLRGRLASLRRLLPTLRDRPELAETVEVLILVVEIIERREAEADS